MSVVRPSIEDGAAACSDPWDWGVEDVVDALCKPKSQLRRAHPSISFPDDTFLAGKIRELDVTGLALLKKVDGACLKTDFGIKSMGHLASLEELIEVLQWESAKYQVCEARRNSSVAARSTAGWASRMQTPYNSTFFQHGLPPGGLPPWQSPRTRGNGERPPLNGTTGAAREFGAKMQFNDLHEGPPILYRPDWTVPQDLALEHGTNTPNYNDRPDTGGNDSPVAEGKRILQDQSAPDVPFPLPEALPANAAAVSGGVEVFTDKSGRKRKRLAPINIESLEKADVGPGAPPDRPTPGLQHDSNDDSSMTIGREPETEQSSHPSPQLYHSDHSPSFHVEKFRDQEDGHENEPVPPMPGVIHIDHKGRKRVVPIFQNVFEGEPEEQLISLDKVFHAKPTASPLQLLSMDPNDILDISPLNYGRRANRSPEKAYLGHESLSVDSLFYDDTKLGGVMTDSDQSDADNFNFTCKRPACEGQRLYVHHRMRHYLQQQLVILGSHERQALGLVPYPPRIGRKFHPLSMTVFAQDARHSLRIVRANRSHWLSDNSSGVRSISKTANEPEVFNVPNTSMAMDEMDEEWKALEKWRHLGTADETLPIYGESGSENEYDFATWKEMEEEAGAPPPRAEGRPRKPSLEKHELEAAIDEAVRLIVQQWAGKKLPKLQAKAWRLWTRTRRYQSWQHDIRELEECVTMLVQRTETLRGEIAAEHWTNKVKVIRQCNILQPSLFDLEECKWRKSIIELPKAPEKVSVPRMLRPRPSFAAVELPIPEGEENIVSGSDAFEEAEDSIDDFVTSDDEDEQLGATAMNADGDLTMAESENEVEMPFGGVDALLPSDSPKVLSIEQGAVLPSPIKSVEVEQGTIDPQVIDLTQASSDVELIGRVSLKREMTPGVRTSPVDNGNETDFWVSKNTNGALKQVPSKPGRKSSYIDLEGSSEESDFPSKFTTVTAKPPFNQVNAICQMDVNKLVEEHDRKRLLIWILARTDHARRQLVVRMLATKSMEVMQSYVPLGIKAFLSHQSGIRKLDTDQSEVAMQLTAWFVSWTIPVRYSSDGVDVGHLQTTKTEVKEGFELFYDFLLLCMNHYQEARPVESTPKAATSSSDVAPQKTKRQKIVRDEPVFRDCNTQQRKRKYEVHESQDTINKRNEAQERVRTDEERRRKQLTNTVAKLDLDYDDDPVIVNPGKLDDQDFIHLDSRFGNGRYLRAHQKEGLQFLWREITADHNDMQGCMLAHTMGLGKTVQVIALLVALAGASRSLEKNVRNQVPPALQQPQTLVLCPPALLENWFDEMLMWVPKDDPEMIGKLRKVSAIMNLRSRVVEIEEWASQGGVLLMPYSIFSYLIDNKGTTRGPPPLDHQSHETIMGALLEKTNIVIADEAHEFKNRSSQLNRCITSIQTTSRIALTGSPLSNNLSEFFEIINWIAPTFLGTRTDFRATYEEPIGEGLYQDSSNGHYRAALKRLKTLQLEVEPKVHRADVAVLHGELHGKMEFVIKLPLTELQLRLYRTFVDVTWQSVNHDEPQQSTWWTWLWLLQLLCHHPKLYWDKLLSLQAEPQDPIAIEKTSSSKKTGSRLSTPDVSPTSDNDEPSILKQPESWPVIQRVIKESRDHISRYAGKLHDLQLSYKMQSLMHIIQLSATTGDKILVFSHRVPSLNYVANYLECHNLEFARIDGKVLPQKRQAVTKSFNDGSINICLVSTKAGGVGLNLFGANRVIIIDEWFNPMLEQQAVGRAYRIGQLKKVFVYRILAAGTFEEVFQNQGLYKEQLANRVVDKKNPIRSATKGARQWVFLPKEVKQENLDQFRNKDPFVLDHLLSDSDKNPVLSITPTESFHIEEKADQLTAEEKKEAEQMWRDEQLRRRDPTKYQKILSRRQEAALSAPQEHQVPVLKPEVLPPTPISMHPVASTAREYLEMEQPHEGVSWSQPEFQKLLDEAVTPSRHTAQKSSHFPQKHKITPMHKASEATKNGKSPSLGRRVEKSSSAHKRKGSLLQDGSLDEEQPISKRPVLNLGRNILLESPRKKDQKQTPENKNGQV